MNETPGSQFPHSNLDLAADIQAAAQVDEFELPDAVAAAERFMQRQRDEITEIQEKSSIDSLTGFYTRGKFDEEFDDLLSRSTRVGVLYLDADRFKKVNDDHGHAEGDRVLKKSAEVIESSLRETDAVSIIGRYGGDEIVALLDLTPSQDPVIHDKRKAKELTDEQRLVAAAVRTQNALREAGFSWSIGARLRKGDETAEELVHAADQNMYENKRASRRAQAS